MEAARLPGQDVWWDEYAGKWIAAFGGEIGHYWSSPIKGAVSVMLAPHLTSGDIVEFLPAVLPLGVLRITSTRP